MEKLLTGAHPVSCLCVTHRRVPMLRRAIACFLKQSHPARELVVLHEDGDLDTKSYLAGLCHPMIRSLEVPSTPRLSLGAKRNALVQAARGRYVATWDDDDWHAPTRLAAQLRAISESGRPACVLQHHVIFDSTTSRAWVSQGRNWENTLLAERDAMPPYADLDVAEDVPCVYALAAHDQLIMLASPHLYIYLYHGANTAGAAHFANNVFAHSTPLTVAGSQRVRALLAAPQGAPLTLDEVLASRAAAPRPRS